MPGHNLKKNQISNLEAILKAAKDFSNCAGINFSNPLIEKDTIVFESGHQPNFLPHSGFWKKLYLLTFLKNKYKNQGKKAIALFGLVDHNLCTSKLLTQNKLPALNKMGYENVGFKIQGDNIWKRFDCIECPEEEEWKKEMGKIISHYKKYSMSLKNELDPGELMEILDESYRSANNFSDLNSFFAAKVCNKLFDLDISFFRYSDLQRNRIFLEEWKNVISRIHEYNSIYNSSIKKHSLDIPLCAPDSFPFWYHCPCGAKVHLFLTKDQVSGRCRLCSRDHTISIENLKESFDKMSPNAVVRNIIFSEGMGTHMFISGWGGSLKYGNISKDISRVLGFNLPVTVSWKSKDYYMGPAHNAALRELGKICHVTEENIRKDINITIKDNKTRITEMTIKAREKGDKEAVRKYEEQYRSFGTTVSIIKKVYSTTPSFMDIYVSEGVKRVKECWENVLKDIGDNPLIEKDVVYGEENIVSIYRKIEGING